MHRGYLSSGLDYSQMGSPCRYMLQPARPLGDPEGRRLARRRASALAEASLLAHALECLLRRTDFDTSACRALRERIASQEQAELLRGYGRIESRKRFKQSSGHPLYEKRTPNF